MKRAVVLLVLLAASDAGAKCAMETLTSELVTHPGDAFPSGGGVLDEWSATTDSTVAHSDSDPSVHAHWAFREKRRLVKTEKVTLAPGLTVYRPLFPAGKVHVVKLVGDGGKALGTFTRSAKSAAPLAAPAVAKVTHEASTHSYRGTRIHVDAVLTSPPPADAYGLIALDASGHPLTWGRVDRASDDDASTIEIYVNAYHCNVIPPGMTEPNVGDEITLVWVDRFGVESAPSAPIKVETAP